MRKNAQAPAVEHCFLADLLFTCRSLAPWSPGNAARWEQMIDIMALSRQEDASEAPTEGTWRARPARAASARFRKTASGS